MPTSAMAAALLRALALLSALAALAAAAPRVHKTRHHHHNNPTALPLADRVDNEQPSSYVRAVHDGALPRTARTGRASATSATIALSYHGGEIMAAAGSGPLTVFLVTYGASASYAFGATADVAALSFFVSNVAAAGVAASPNWYSMLSSGYNDGAGAFPAPRLALGGTVALVPADVPGVSTPLTETDVFSIAQAGAAKAAWALDPTAVYVVVTGPTIRQTLGGSSLFCTAYCGWHASATAPAGGEIKFAFVGDPTACPSSCDVLHSSGGQGLSPNAWSWQSNAMASILAHELAETITNPVSSGWSTSTGAETGDLCAWTFGATATSPGSCNGTSAACAQHNILLGGVPLLIQQIVRQSPPALASTARPVPGACSMCASKTCPRPR